MIISGGIFFWIEGLLSRAIILVVVKYVLVFSCLFDKIKKYVFI